MPAEDWATGKLSPYFNGSSLDTRCKVCKYYDCEHEDQLMDIYSDYTADEFNSEQETVAQEYLETVPLFSKLANPDHEIPA